MLLIVATVKIDDAEVAHTVDRAQNIHQMLSTIAAQIASLQQDEQTGRVEDFRPVAIAIDTYETDAASPAAKKGG
jgi:hypothetical protein